MRSGAIRRQVELWKKVSERNGFGEYKESWTFFKKMRAYRGSVRGMQVIDNNEIFDLNWVRISIRNQHPIDETDRIKYKGSLYTIEHIKYTDDERWLTVLCKRINE